MDVTKICEAIKRGEDATRLVAQIEPELAKYCDVRNGYTLEKVMEDVKGEDALYDVSASVKNYWATLYPTIDDLEYKYQKLIRFVSAYEQFLGVSHTESVQKLKNCGWTNTGIMAAYIHNRVAGTQLRLSPDVAAQAAKEDWEMALKLLEGKGYDELFPFYHDSFQIVRQFEWVNFMYYFMGYEDQTFLRKKHKSKRLCKHCEEVLYNLEHCTVKKEHPDKAAACPDFSVFQGVVLQQGHLMHSAAGQKLYKGNDRNFYVMSFHLVDEENGCGAAICFAPLDKGPQYFDQTSKVHGVHFYRFDHLYLSDYIPESRRCAPETMPEEFAKWAHRAFSMLAKL